MASISYCEQRRSHQQELLPEHAVGERGCGSVETDETEDAQHHNWKKIPESETGRVAECPPLEGFNSVDVALGDRVWQC